MTRKWFEQPFHKDECKSGTRKWRKLSVKSTFSSCADVVVGSDFIYRFIFCFFVFFCKNFRLRCWQNRLSTCLIVLCEAHGLQSKLLSDKILEVNWANIFFLNFSITVCVESHLQCAVNFYYYYYYEDIATKWTIINVKLPLKIKRPITFESETSTDSNGIKQITVSEMYVCVVDKTERERRNHEGKCPCCAILIAILHSRFKLLWAHGLWQCTKKTFGIVMLHNCWFFGFLVCCLPQFIYRKINTAIPNTIEEMMGTQNVRNKTSIQCLVPPTLHLRFLKRNARGICCSLTIEIWWLHRESFHRVQCTQHSER